MVSLAQMRIKASTLMESIVASVIIFIIFSIVASLLVQSTSMGFSIQRLKLNEDLIKYANRSMDAKEFFNDVIADNEYTIERKISAYGGNERIVQLTFSVFDTDRKLIEKQDYLCTR